MSDTLSDATNELNHVADQVTETVSSKTKRFPAIHKFVNKRNVLIFGASLIVLVILSVGIALYQNHQNVEAARAYAARQDAIKAEAVRAKQIEDLNKRITDLGNDKAVLCKHLDSLQRNRPTRGLVTIPTTANCTI